MSLLICEPISLPLQGCSGCHLRKMWMFLVVNEHQCSHIDWIGVPPKLLFGCCVSQILSVRSIEIHLSISGMMEPMPSPQMHPSQPMMMGHPAHHASGHPGAPPHPGMMPQSPSPYAHPSGPDFGPPMHGGHPGFPGDFPPGGPGHPAMSRQMSHPGAHGMPPQQMMMSPQGGPYMNGPAGPYM